MNIIWFALTKLTHCIYFQVRIFSQSNVIATKNCSWLLVMSYDLEWKLHGCTRRLKSSRNIHLHVLTVENVFCAKRSELLFPCRQPVTNTNASNTSHNLRIGLYVAYNVCTYRCTYIHTFIVHTHIPNRQQRILPYHPKKKLQKHIIQ